MLIFDQSRIVQRLLDTLRKSFALQDMQQDTQSSTKGEILHSRQFTAILRQVTHDIGEETTMDEKFRHFSREYNRSLQDGRFEHSVIYLMLMRMIDQKEGAPGDANALSRIALRIIREKLMR